MQEKNWGRESKEQPKNQTRELKKRLQDTIVNVYQTAHLKRRKQNGNIYRRMRMRMGVRMRRGMESASKRRANHAMGTIIQGRQRRGSRRRECGLEYGLDGRLSTAEVAPSSESDSYRALLLRRRLIPLRGWVSTSLGGSTTELPKAPGMAIGGDMPPLPTGTRLRREEVWEYDEGSEDSLCSLK